MSVQTAVEAETKKTNGSVGLPAIYIVKYKRGGATRERNFYAQDSNDALGQAKKYCERINGKVVHIRPFVESLDQLED